MGLPKDGDDTWKSNMELLEKIAKKAGRLLKGGEPCIRSAAIYVINDFQRGRLPHFVAPPELKDNGPETPNVSKATLPGIKGVEQKLDEIGTESDGRHEEQEDQTSSNNDEDNIIESEDEGSDSEGANDD